jgi:hypothetical protein
METLGKSPIDSITFDKLTSLIEVLTMMSSLENKKMKDDYFLWTKFTAVSLNNVCVKKSKIHGNGVFATRNLKKNDVITFYPSHCIKTYSLNNRKETQWAEVGFSDYASTEFKNLMKKNNIMYEDYKQNISDKISIIGDPNDISDPNYLGHIINDGAKSSSPKDKEIYEFVSREKMNSFVCPLKYGIIAIVALKDISIYEEIFTTYFYEYWMDKHKC